MEVELVHLNRSSGKTWVLPSSQLIFIQGSYHKKLWKSLENCKKKNSGFGSECSNRVMVILKGSFSSQYFRLLKSRWPITLGLFYKKLS